MLMTKSMMKAGPRTNAIKQMDDWFERVALGNYDGKHFGNVHMASEIVKIDNRA
jgi:hypothetical protein